MSPSPSTAAPARWEFWIDVGGTFTDCIARGPDDAWLRRKVLSSGKVKGRAQRIGPELVRDPARCTARDDFWRGYWFTVLDAGGNPLHSTDVISSSADGSLRLAANIPDAAGESLSYELTGGEEAPILAVRLVLGLKLDEDIPPLSMRLGTTRGTNALLTRRGARVALITTRGFADALYIGYQDRPALFDLQVRRPRPLYERVLELDERIAHDGQVLVPLPLDQLPRELEALQAAGIAAIAICLLNSYANAIHEQQVAQIARAIGFADVSVSSEIAPLIKLVARGDTTVLNAYLNPVLRGYVSRIQQALGPQSDLRLLTSAGGLVRAASFAGTDSILSGPAGGVVGFSRSSQAAGFAQAIGFDMGGTSTDVSRFDGKFELQYESEKAGVRVVAPMMAIETVAAGGGSICAFDGVKLTVGPDSAGADPGPACYGRGGPLTITDLNVFLGRIPAERFPFPLDTTAVQQRLSDLGDEIARSTQRLFAPAELAEGLITIADSNMAQAIRSISIAKGYDPKAYVLAAFGGAAPQHACAVADILGIQQILIHPDAGLLSALGIGTANVVRHKAAGLYQPLEHVQTRLPDVFSELATEALAELASEGVATERARITRALDLRFQGLDASLTIAEPDDGNYHRAYWRSYQQLYGDCPRDRSIEAVAARIEAVGLSAHALPRSTSVEQRRLPLARSTTSVYFNGRLLSTNVFDREQLLPGHRLMGPTIVVEPYATVIVAPGWRAEVLSGGELLLTPAAEVNAAANVTASTSAATGDPIALEIFHHHFAAIATQMGITLRNTSSSVNVKERLDYSCAVFTAAGDLVANAPHIPVHLGAMGETVKAILQENADIADGDVLVTNDPYRGGSHLPDVTVVTPVFAEGQLVFFTASRAHHAEIGGIAPGSMPPSSRNLAEEGVLIQNFRLSKQGQWQWQAMRDLLLSGTYPTRNVGNNLADMAAQVAANRQGAQDLLALVARCGLETVLQYTQHIQLAAEQKMRLALARLTPGTRHFADHLDDGTPIAVTLTIEGDRAVIDFAGTGPVVPGNLNANRAIVTAAVMYAFRCLLSEDIPLNQGVLSPLEICLPPCLLNPAAGKRPEDSPAVAGGNVETSQRVVDVLLAALDAAAASQGTMNNFTFGDGTFGYYETICGGAGATATADGESAIHTHMTNTRLTDPEVFEQRFPARVLQFSIRRGSGGAGRQRGGDGALRRFEFLRDLQVSLVTQRRGPYPPFGLHGGKPGSCGHNRLFRRGGAVEELANIVSCAVSAGDVLEIATPGGGGWGPVADD